MIKNLLKQKPIYILTFILVLLISFLVSQMLLKRSKNDKNQVNTEIIEENQELIEIMPEKPENDPDAIYGITTKLDNYAEYLDVKECIDSFNKNQIILYSNRHPYNGEENVNTYNSDAKTIEKIYNQLDQQFLDYYRVEKENLINVIDLGLYKFNIYDVYKRMEKGNNISNYLAYGKLIDMSNGAVNDYAFIVRVDSKKKVYSIIPNNYIVSNRINENNLIIQNNEIAENDINKIELNNFDKGKYCLALFENYKANLLYDQAKAFNQLDSEYRDNRFQSYADFCSYIADNEKQLRISSLGSYNLTYKEEYTECTVFDKNSRCYIIKAKTPTDYTVMLDDGAILSDEYIKEYNESSDEKKVYMIVNRLEDLINEDNYYFLYNKLNENFRKNKIESKEYLQNLIESNIYDTSNIAIESMTKQGDTYIVKCKSKSRKGNNYELRDITFLINLKNDADFEFSLSV